LTCSRTSTSKQSSLKRIGLVVFTVIVLLYFCGFRVPGFGQKKQVVIILAANIGGGKYLLSPVMSD
jgi:low affinity Fe/Cu permease